MAWIGKSQGVFRLHDSDNYCGSYISVPDAAEILEVDRSCLAALPLKTIDDEQFVSELDIHKAWGSGKIQSPQKPQHGTAKRSFDEIIVRKLLQITLPGCLVECQIPFRRKRVDLKVTYDGRCVLLEFVGPSHFIPQYQREPTSPLSRRREVEDHFGFECVIWPYWIQRCSRNVLALLDPSAPGLASVWSTKALFGDFVFPQSAGIIVDLTTRFNAFTQDGIGYMYGNRHTHKPIHPIVQAILTGKEDKSRLIPRGTDKPEEFWLPRG
jgi:hypothetical protein